ncbi:antibiotic biosynthesis monooxygenase [Flavobacterium sp.]|uniref:antibiotic biosynthesis monooxygenase family protein n=1 Tax=Flavobacterium sp. TaxID=239 RepID=UPI0028BE60C1|nr:antibiotic biosynthesis monooxygenase [Flavobacterium sp.]
MIAKTQETPYYAVIFTSVRTEIEDNYGDTANRMMELAAEQPGFLGVESARNEIGITVSYWSDLEAIKNWKMNAEHTIARETGRSDWYQAFKVRIAKVERDYDFTK